MKAVLSILEPHLLNSNPPPPSEDYSSTWDSMDSGIPNSAPSHDSTGSSSGGPNTSNPVGNHVMPETRNTMTFHVTGR